MGLWGLPTRTRGWHPPLMWLFWLMVPVTVLCALGVAVDDRVLLGAPVWLKPLKFSVSIALYALTWAWMLELGRRGRFHRVMWWAGTVSAVLLFVEIVVIATQSARGTRSHFNLDSPLNSALFEIMATSIIIVWVANLLQAVILIRAGLGDRALAWAVRLGVVISLIGMAEAFLMTAPTAEQAGVLRAHGRSDTVGAHGVGVADGGPGLPVTGWSTVGGDLRVGHFVGIHALQVLPLLALTLSARPPGRWDETTRVRLVWTTASAYLGLVALVTWQALRGQPLTGPDALTLSVFGALLLATAVAVRWSLTGRSVRSRPSGERPRVSGGEPR